MQKQFFQQKNRKQGIVSQDKTWRKHTFLAVLGMVFQPNSATGPTEGSSIVCLSLGLATVTTLSRTGSSSGLSAANQGKITEGNPTISPEGSRNWKRNDRRRFLNQQYYYQLNYGLFRNINTHVPFYIHQWHYHQVINSRNGPCLAVITGFHSLTHTHTRKYTHRERE